MAQGASADFSHHIGGMIIRRKNVGEILWAERPNKGPPLHRNPQSSIFDPRRLFPTVTPPVTDHTPSPAPRHKTAFWHIQKFGLKIVDHRDLQILFEQPDDF